MPLSHGQATQILDFLDSVGSNFVEFTTIILHPPLNTHNVVASLSTGVTAILGMLSEHQLCQYAVDQWVHERAVKQLTQEITNLTRKSSGWHFGASTAKIEKLESFDLSNMVQEMKVIAPRACNLISCLLESDGEANRGREVRRLTRIARAKENKKYRRGRMSMHGDDSDGDDSDGDDALWAAVGGAVGVEQVDDGASDRSDDLWAQLGGVDGDHGVEVGAQGDGHESDGSEDLWRQLDGVDGTEGGAHEEDEDRASYLRERVLMIRLVTCLSILMQSTNQHCNALQCIVGLFLHTCHVPQAAINLLARMGCSISMSSINNAVTSLSKESAAVIEKIGQSLLTSFVYDNIDPDIRRLVPTIENPHNTLIHLTAGMVVPLQHGVTREDLNCSQELWEKQRNMSSATIDLDKLRTIQADNVKHPSGLLRRQRFNAWVILYTLVHHGPVQFHQYRRKLGKPEVIEQIPIAKSRHVPVRTMDINPSTVGANADVLEDMFRQAGIGDPTEEGQAHVTAVENTVILVHGDLGTGERIESLQQARAAERTPARRLQNVVFVPGLFHLKMACADALWRIFIEPKQSHDDANSLFRHVGQIRPKETVKFASNPGFRRMHEVIQHIGIVSRLDFWREKVKGVSDGYATLNDFAKSNPSWETLMKLANELALEQVAGSNLERLRRRPKEERDMERENMLIRQRYFLLYEEITYAMNTGDIGRAEACFLPWIYIFRGCGKHKYAAFMMKYLHNVHFVYPEGLKRAVRMNILCNPTGKPNNCRAHDWVQEHHNLFTKTSNGGDGSNYRKEHIIKESPLLEVYRNIQEQLEDTFENQRGNRHSSPNMERTFQVLARYMEKTRASSTIPGRSARYPIPDTMANGMHILMSAESREVDSDPMNEEADGEREVEDRGDLQVE
ncbi:hypothetical protein QCA50_004608 [Cerrena zonata]|uniref:DUF6589 domain-containing protein n=1 Tax=Cerrena zonata TaxID=2478898 RepID=A0AAW0GSR3_9APHY